MEEWEASHIKANLVDLLDLTICNTGFLAFLEQHNVLSNADLDELNRQDFTQRKRTKLLFDILQTRDNAFSILLKALHFARQTGSLRIIRHGYLKKLCSEMTIDHPLLQALEADLPNMEKFGKILLYRAVEQNKPVRILKLIVDACCGWKSIQSTQLDSNHEKSLNFQTQNGESVMHIASERGNCEALEYLLRMGAPVDEKDDDGYTPLLYLQYCKQGLPKCLSVLLKNGAQINCTDSDGYNLIQLATGRHRSLEDLKHIVQNGCDWKHRNNIGFSVLHLASAAGNLEAVKYFIDLGAKIDEKDSFLCTPLLYLQFCRYKLAKILDVLLENGADINATDNNGYNLIQLAAVQGRSVEDLKYIVARGCDWRLRNNHDKSSLHLACEGGNFEAVKYFISLGANIHERDTCRSTPLLFLKSCKQNLVKILDVLLENGAEINDTDNNGCNLIQLAAYKGRSVEDLKHIVARGCDWRHRNNYGLSSLHVACQGGNFEAVKYFISLGANIHERSVSGRTPMLWLEFCEQNLIESLDALLENGADINCTQNDGSNLIQLSACEGRSIEVLNHIIKRGCDWKHKNKAGKSALDLALDRGHVETAEYFRDLEQKLTKI